jgi:hypothetical protein
MAVPKVFISYRHGLAGGHAGRIDQAVAARFGRRNVYFDTHGLPGFNILKEITQAVAGCRALLVVIGPGWAEQRDQDGRVRLEKEHDLVRREVETGLQHDEVVVIPLLVGGAHMPRPEQLPPALRSLTDRRGLDLHDSHWDSDVDRLLSALEDRRLPGSSLLIGGIALAALSGFAARGLQGVLPDPEDQGTDAARIATSMLRRAGLWAWVAAALAVWLEFAHWERGWRLVEWAFLGFVVGALGGALAEALVAVPQYLWDEPRGRYQVAAVAIVGAVMGALLGGLWHPKRLLLGLVTGSAAGVLVELFLRSSVKRWDPLTDPETQVGTRAAVITAAVLGVLLALDALQAPSRKGYDPSAHPI